MDSTINYSFTRMFSGASMLFFILLLSLTAAGQNTDPNLGIIPAPASIKRTTGEFIFSKRTLIKATNPSDKAVVFLKEYLQDEWETRNPPVEKLKSNTPNTLLLTSEGTDSLPAEGYRITITQGKITIAGKGAGLFYGIQTFIQLLAVKNNGIAKIPCAVIEDHPRFEYRGLLLDVSRHFFPAPYVKKLINLMAYYKLNTFHWHLVDNTGWRIEIKKYPKLTEVGAFRNSTSNQHGDYYDQIPYGGFYTQQEIKDIVKYAAEKYIDIIPEIEMPAHSYAALRAYPELKCEPLKDGKNQGLYDMLYCPTEQTFSFLEDVLTEVIALFPSKYIHIGGDEANKTPWKESAYAQKLIRDNNLKDEHGLQSYFIRRIEKFLNSKGRDIIGWDEILEGGLAPNATVMSWRGENGGIAAAKQKHNVIMTPGPQGLYFDYYQSKSPMEPINIGGYAPLKLTYSYNPVPEQLTPDEKKYIKGVQGSLWTEYVTTPSKVEYMILPRLFALSEIAWTPLERKDYKNFSQVRLPKHLQKLDIEGYNYRVPVAGGAADATLIGAQFTFNLESPLPDAKIYYTINGHTPQDTDREYTSPLTFFIPPNESRELQTIVVSPAGRRSVATRTIMHNRQPLQAINYTPQQQGLKYKLYNGNFKSVEELDHVAATDSGIVSTISAAEFRKNSTAFGLQFEGYIKIETDNIYTFYLASDDGSQLFIDGEKIVDNDDPYLMFPATSSVPLSKGYHKIKIKYFNKSAVSAIKLSLSSPGQQAKEFSPELLFN